MNIHNSQTHYGSITKTFHWLTALLILSAFPLGILANNAAFATSEEIAQKAWLFSLHKTIGVTVFFTALLRILWTLTQTSPADLHPDRKLESYAAHLVHWLLYISMLLVPLTGWINHAASVGFAPILWPFGQSLPLIPKSEAVSAFFSAGHFVFTKLLLASVVLHVAGALKHVVIDRDQTMRRMLAGHADVPPQPAQSRSSAPLFTALIIYTGAIGLGALIGLSKPDEPIESQQLASVASDWTVIDGSLEITITQFGSEVTGTFSDWTAEIEFEPTTKTGTVDVIVAIGSLTLGSLSAQALGADFFDVQTHPTARFTANIQSNENLYEAQGALTLKGAEQPTTLPFSLEIDGNTAVMAGELLLNRLDFGVGKTLPDEASLKFDVMVGVNLTATRGE